MPTLIKALSIADKCLRVILLEINKMGTVNLKFQIQNLIFIITGIFLATLFLGSLVQTALAQSPTCYNPATGAVCTDTPGPTSREILSGA